MFVRLDFVIIYQKEKKLEKNLKNFALKKACLA